MRLTPVQYAKTLQALSRESLPAHALAAGFLSFLRRRRAMKKLPEILRLFEVISDEEAGRLSLTVETVAAPSSELSASLESLASSLFPGKKLVFRYKRNERLLGGVRISSSDEMVDATVRRRLRELESRIT